MKKELEEKLKAAGVTGEELSKVVDEAIRTARALPVIKAEASATGKITWAVRYPIGYEDRTEQDIIELGTKDPEVMIVAVDSIQQIVDAADPTVKTYFEVNGRVIIDKRNDVQRSLKNRGQPTKGCTVIFEDHEGNLRVGMFYISPTNLKAMDVFAKRVKKTCGNFSVTTVRITTQIKSDGVRKWILYDYDLGKDPDDKWVSAFIKGIDEVRERERIYSSDQTTGEQAEAPGMGDSLTG